MIKAYSKDLDYSYVEGFFPTFELVLNKKDKLKNIYVSENALNSDGYNKLVDLVGRDKIITSEKAFSVSGAKENSHVLAAFDKFESTLDSNLDHLVLVNPADMGNLGNAMRSLLAFSLHDLAIIKPSADIFNPKVLRASMGSIFKIRIELFDSFNQYLDKYKRDYYPFVLSKNSKSLNDITFTHPCSLVFGNEASGLPNEIYNENNVKIEQSDEVDSLNLTTSIAIGLYKLKLQKNKWLFYSLFFNFITWSFTTNESYIVNTLV